MNTSQNMPSELALSVTQDIETGDATTPTPTSSLPIAIALIMIDITSEINHHRLYWLWIKYALSAMLEEQWTGQKQIQTILATLGSITDTLSYSLYGIRALMLIFYVSQTYTTKPCFNDVLQSISDALWGTSNAASALLCPATTPRPRPLTGGWYGNLSMQLLLIYDVLSLATRCNYNHFNPEATKNDTLTQQYRQHVLKSELGYAILLAAGFFMFRGFFIANKTLKPSWGSLLCVNATIIYEALKCGYLHHHQQVLAKQNRSTPIHNPYSMFTYGIAQALFPSALWLSLWISLDAPYILGLIASSFSIMGILHAYGKYQAKEMRSSLISHSLFNSSCITHPDTMIKSRVKSEMC